MVFIICSNDYDHYLISKYLFLMSIITHILLISVYLYFLIDVFNEQTRQITKKIEKSKQPTTIEPKNIVTTNPTGNWFYFIVHAHKTFVFCTFPCSQYVAQVLSVQSILGIFRTIFLFFSTFSSVFFSLLSKGTSFNLA